MGSLQAGAVGTAPVVRPSLDCPGLVWRPTAGQASKGGPAAARRLKLGLVLSDPPPPQYSPSRESLVLLIGALLCALSLLKIGCVALNPL